MPLRCEPFDTTVLLAALDDTLVTLGWRDVTRAGRPLEARMRGVVGLLRKSMIVAIAQWVVIGMAIVLGGTWAARARIVRAIGKSGARERRAASWEGAA